MSMQGGSPILFVKRDQGHFFHRPSGIEVTRKTSYLGIVDSINRSVDMKQLISEFYFQFTVKHELLDFCVNVKEYYELCVTCEKPQYFDVNVICKVV